MRRLPVILTLAALAAATVLIAPTASAAQPDLQYLQMQNGVTYTVYAPKTTIGLKLQGTIGNTNTCATNATMEERITANYGSRSGARFSLWEGNPLCMDFGPGATVGTEKIGSATATISAYCDPSKQKPCVKQNVRTDGGKLTVTLPAGSGLRPTQIVIETFGGKKHLSYEQLLTVARSLVPVV